MRPTIKEQNLFAIRNDESYRLITYRSKNTMQKVPLVSILRAVWK